MKTIGIILIAIFLINASFKPAQDAAKVKVYEYITINVYGIGNPDVYITESGEKFEKIKLRGKQHRQLFDNAEIFKLLNKYEAQGYELFSTNSLSMGTSGAIIYLLRREKK